MSAYSFATFAIDELSDYEAAEMAHDGAIDVQQAAVICLSELANDIEGADEDGIDELAKKGLAILAEAEETRFDGDEPVLAGISLLEDALLGAGYEIN